MINTFAQQVISGHFAETNKNFELVLLIYNLRGIK